MNTRTLFLRASVTLGLASLFALSTLAADSDRIVIPGFSSPESVVHDSLTDVYLLSNVGGPPVILNHGFISRVSPQGAVLDLKWIEDGVNGATLHGPKGIWLHRGELYVVDVDTLRIFNRLAQEMGAKPLSDNAYKVVELRSRENFVVYVASAGRLQPIDECIHQSWTRFTGISCENYVGSDIWSYLQGSFELLV